jgi:hypothetical protein
MLFEFDTVNIADGFVIPIPTVPFKFVLSVVPVEIVHPEYPSMYSFILDVPVLVTLHGFAVSQLAFVPFIVLLAMVI